MLLLSQRQAIKSTQWHSKSSHAAEEDRSFFKGREGQQVPHLLAPNELDVCRLARRRESRNWDRSPQVKGSRRPQGCPVLPSGRLRKERGGVCDRTGGTDVSTPTLCDPAVDDGHGLLRVSEEERRQNCVSAIGCHASRTDPSHSPSGITCFFMEKTHVGSHRAMWHRTPSQDHLNILYPLSSFRGQLKRIGDGRKKLARNNFGFQLSQYQILE